MSGPWEKYNDVAQSSAPVDDGPWAKYSDTPAVEMAPKKELTFNQKLLNLLKPVGQALDYGGGIVRTGIGEAMGAASGNDVVRDGDWSKAFKGEAPSSAELLDRAGVPQGGQLSDVLPSAYSETGDGLALQKGGWADPTARGAAGLAMDITTDPLTYLSGGLSVASKAKDAGKVVSAANKVVNPASNLMERLGKDIYKSGLKRIDQEALKYGKEPVSDLLMKEGVTGSYGKISKEMDRLAADRVTKQKAILQAADDAGVKVDMSQAMKSVDELIGDYKASRDPLKQQASARLSGDSARYKSLDTLPEGVQGPVFPIGVQQANDFKTSIYNEMPKGAFAEAISNKSKNYLAGQKAMARGLKEGVEGAAAQIGRGDELRQLNDELGRLLTTQDRAAAEAFKEGNKNMLTSVDGGLIGMAQQNPYIFAAKKAADVAKMTGPRTTTGKFMYDQGRGQLSGPVWDLLLRQQLINRDQQK